MILNRKERLSKNQFDLTVRKDERFLLSLSLLRRNSSFSCKHSLFMIVHSQSILKIHETELSVNPQHSFSFTLRKDYRENRHLYSLPLFLEVNSVSQLRTFPIHSPLLNELLPLSLSLVSRLNLLVSRLNPCPANQVGKPHILILKKEQEEEF